MIPEVKVPPPPDGIFVIDSSTHTKKQRFFIADMGAELKQRPVLPKHRRRPAATLTNTGRSLTGSPQQQPRTAGAGNVPLLSRGGGVVTSVSKTNQHALLGGISDLTIASSTAGAGAGGATMDVAAAVVKAKASCRK